MCFVVGFDGNMWTFELRSAVGRATAANLAGGDVGTESSREGACIAA